MSRVKSLEEYNEEFDNEYTDHMSVICYMKTGISFMHKKMVELEPVTCGKCKHFNVKLLNRTGQKANLCENKNSKMYLTIIYNSQNWFCADGERKE